MTKKIILAFETSGPLCSAAIWGEGEVMACAQESIGYGHASSLFNFVRDVSAQARMPLEYISHVAVTRGPGSFTGVRVGLAAARGFSLAGSLPILGMTTFDLLSHTTQQKIEGAHPHLVVLDTKRGDFYTAFYEGEGTPAAHTKISTPDDIYVHTEPYKNSGTPIYIIGDGAAKLEQSLEWPAHVKFLTLSPNAADLATAAAYYSEVGGYEFSSEPFYLRPPKVYE